MIDEQSMVFSYVLYILYDSSEAQQVLFPKVGFVINQSGIANMSDPNQKINKVKIQVKNMKVV